MGFLDRLLGRDRDERRSMLGAWPLGSAIGFGPAGAVPAVHQAEKLSAVLGCVELISGALASLPASLTIDGSAGRTPAPRTAAAWSLIERPNRQQSWPAFMAWAAGQLLLHGNAVAWISSNGLTPVPWQWLRPLIIGSAGGPRLAFDLIYRGPENSLLGLPARFLDSDVMHVKARSDYGILGRSVLSRAAGPVREGLEIETLAESNWRHGMRPSGVMMAPAYLTKQQRADSKEFLAHYSGAVNTGKVPLLEGGWSFLQTSMSSVDAEFLASRHFSVAEICRLFCVPETLLQLGTRLPTDMPGITAQLATQALAPLVALIEHEFSHAVLPAGMCLELDLSGLMRGSFSAMTGALCALVQSGICTPNDARSWLGGLPAIAGGDVLRVGPPPTWPADGPGLPHLGPSPGPTGGGLAAPGTHQNNGAGGKANGAA